LVDVVWGDGDRRIFGEFFNDFLGEGIDEPGLSLGEVEGELSCFWGEELSRIVAMLLINCGDILWTEVAEG
jgi:hypothetical protein